MRNLLTGRRGAGIAATGLLGLGLGLGLAFAPTAASAADTTSTPTPQASAPAHPRLAEARARHLEGTLAAKGVHGEATIRTAKGFQLVAGQRGQVTAVSPTALTVKSDDGFVGTYVLTADTRYRVDAKAAKLADIHVGATVRVGATVADKVETAVVVAVPKK